MHYRTPFFLPWLFPNLVWRIDSASKDLYLTLDDGPVPGPTEFALDALSQRNVKATFFCIGDNIRKHPELFKKIRQSGHTIGNHTFNHVNGWKTATEEYVYNVNLCAAQIESAGQYTTLFRPPYGRIKRAQIRALSDYRIIMWDVLTNDYESRITPEVCLRNSILAARPGSVIIFHDSYKANRNMRYALPRFIDHFLDKGYTFKVLTQ